MDFNSVLNLIETYRRIYGTDIAIITKDEVPIKSAEEIQILAGKQGANLYKHAPIWFNKNEDGSFAVHSEYTPSGEEGNLDCLRFCDTKGTCSKLEKLAKKAITATS